MSPLEITCSIVLFKNDPVVLRKAIDSVLQTTLSFKLVLIDNSPTDDLRVLKNDSRIEYIFQDKNSGFGRAHNVAMKESLSLSKYHLVLNPDVSFHKGTLEQLYDFMEVNRQVGLVLPKVLDFNARMQHLCKRLPSPLDLILRRFGSNYFSKFFEKRLVRYEMRDKNYDEVFEAPSISGCFMFFRTEALQRTGLFDERFFMYMEDVDISRRMLYHYRNIYYPKVHIYHEHARESYKVNKLLFIHILSAIKYFNKWGWIVDQRRESLNHREGNITLKPALRPLIVPGENR